MKFETVSHQKSRHRFALFLLSLGAFSVFFLNSRARAQDEDCTKRGGQPLWFDTTASIPFFGQQTGCSLGGAIINSSALSNALSPETPLAVLNFRNHPDFGVMPRGTDGAIAYCKKVGGKPISEFQRPMGKSSAAYTELATQFLNCHFSDGSQIEAQTLLKGPQDPGNTALAQAITPPPTQAEAPLQAGTPARLPAQAPIAPAQH